jgi:hypothetical protein
VHWLRDGGNCDNLSRVVVGGVVFLGAAVATTALSSLLSRTPPLETRRIGGCFCRQEHMQTHLCIIDGAVPDQESPSVLPRQQNVGPR